MNNTVNHNTLNLSQPLGIMEKSGDIPAPQPEEVQSVATCIYCGAPIDDEGSFVCDCKERKNAILSDIEHLDEISLGASNDLTPEEVNLVRSLTRDGFHYGLNMYKLGFICGKRTAESDYMEKSADMPAPQSEEVNGIETCIYCGAVLEDGCICGCKEREEALLADIEQIDNLNYEANQHLGINELNRMKENSKGIYDLAINMYKLGVLRSRRTAELTTRHNI